MRVMSTSFAGTPPVTGQWATGLGDTLCYWSSLDRKIRKRWRVRHTSRHTIDRRTENHRDTQSGLLLRVGDARLLNLSCGEEVWAPEGNDGGGHMATGRISPSPAPAGAMVGHHTL